MTMNPHKVWQHAMKRVVKGGKDAGYIALLAMASFVLLGMTMLVFLGSTGNAINQTQANRQFTETRQGTDSALGDALTYLNNYGSACNTNVLPNVCYDSSAKKKTGTSSRGTWTWWYEANRSSVPANGYMGDQSLTGGTLHTTSKAFGKTRVKDIRINRAIVNSYRPQTAAGPTQGLPVYSPTEVELWKNSVSVGAGTSTFTGAVGDSGVYGAGAWNQNAPYSANIVKYVDGVTSSAQVVNTRASITMALDPRVVSEEAKVKCANNPTNTFTGTAYTGGTRVAGTGTNCYNTFTTTTAGSMSGSGVHSAIVNGAVSFPMGFTTPITAQLHLRANTTADITFGRTGQTALMRMDGVFIYAPNANCKFLQPVQYVGSLACKTITMMGTDYISSSSRTAMKTPDYSTGQYSIYYERRDTNY